MPAATVFRTLLIFALSWSLTTLWGCSKAGDGPIEDKSVPSVSQQALDATREYRNAAMMGARGASGLGDERTQAIDNALRQ